MDSKKSMVSFSYVDLPDNCKLLKYVKIERTIPSKSIYCLGKKHAFVDTKY